MKKGKRAYVYKRKHNISNDPNKRKVINKEKKESNNSKIIIIILLLLLLIFLILFFGIYDCNDDSILVNEKQIKYSFKATYQTKKE